MERDKETGLPLLRPVARPLWASEPGPRVVGRLLTTDDSCDTRGCNLEQILMHDDYQHTAIIVHFKFSPAIGEQPLHAIVRSTDSFELRAVTGRIDEILEDAGINASKVVDVVVPILEPPK